MLELQTVSNRSAIRFSLKDGFYKRVSVKSRCLRTHIYKRTIRGPSLVLFVLLFRSLKEFWLPSLKNECLQQVFTPGWSLSLCVEHSIVCALLLQKAIPPSSVEINVQFWKFRLMIVCCCCQPELGAASGVKSRPVQPCITDSWDLFLNSSSQREPRASWWKMKDAPEEDLDRKWD